MISLPESSPIASVPASPVELAHLAVARMIVAAVLGVPPEDDVAEPEPRR